MNWLQILGAAQENVYSGGVASNTSVGNLGQLNVSGGCFASGAAVSNGGKLDANGGSATAISVSSGGSAVVSSGDVLNSAFIKSFASLSVGDGGTEIFSGGTATVFDNGTISGMTVDAGGSAFISGGNVSNVTLQAGVAQALEVLSDGTTNETSIYSGAEFVVSGGGAVFTTVYAGGLEVIGTDGQDGGAHVSGGEQDVYGTANFANLFTGNQVVEDGGTANASIVTDATLTVSSGGTLEGSIALSGGPVSGVIVPSFGAEVVLDQGALTDGATYNFFGTGNTLVIGGSDPSDMPIGGITGFDSSDRIVLSSVSYDASGEANYNSSTGDLAITENGQTYDLNFGPGNFVNDYFQLAQDGSGTEIYDDTVPCYCRGTLIQTDRGQRPVEKLKIGDKVTTASGETRPIKWIGRRSYAGRFVLERKDILPICIKAGALQPNVPRRDLWISPHHAMYLSGMLIEAKDLVNGVSVVQADSVERVEYFHVELETHDVIIAEGALSETYIDIDNRLMFNNAHEYRLLYPDAAPVALPYCPPRCEEGYAIEAARRIIGLRAGLIDQAPVGTLRGYVDIVNAQLVAGWAQNSQHPTVPVCLDIYVGGSQIGQVLANRYRDDLRQACIGDGRHGFEFALPAGCDLASYPVAVRRALDGVLLDLSSEARRALVAAVFRPCSPRATIRRDRIRIYRRAKGW